MSPSRCEFPLRVHREKFKVAAFHLFNDLILSEGAIPDANFVNESEELSIAFMCFSNEEFGSIGFTGRRVFATEFASRFTVYPILVCCAIIYLRNNMCPFV